MKNYDSGRRTCMLRLAASDALLLTLQTVGMKMIHPVRERWSRGFEHLAECHKNWINLLVYTALQLRHCIVIFNNHVVFVFTDKMNEWKS